MDIISLGKFYDLTDPANPIEKEGWHVNSLQPITGADDFLVYPSTPRVNYSGVETCYRYRFDSKEQAELYLPKEDE